MQFDHETFVKSMPMLAFISIYKRVIY